MFTYRCRKKRSISAVFQGVSNGECSEEKQKGEKEDIADIESGPTASSN